MPKSVYGGPYADESAAITAESLKEKPDYDALVKDWNTLSEGAEAYIQKLCDGIESPVGEFVRNVVFIEQPTEGIISPSPEAIEEDIVEDILDDEESA